MKKILLIVLSIAGLCGSILFTSPAYAAEECKFVSDSGQYKKGTVVPHCCGKDKDGNPMVTSLDYNCDSSAGNSFTSLLLYIINFLGLGVGVAVVVGIIFGGISYAMAEGDMAKTKEGKEMIVNSIIGLFLFLFMYAAANFLIPGGLFKP